MTSCRDKKSPPAFHTLYVNLCSRLGIAPLPVIKYHSDRNCLDFYADRIKLDSWGPILNALSLDKSLHFIAIRNKHNVKDVLEDMDTESKAQSVTSKPAIMTGFIISQVATAVTNCLHINKILTSVELEGLPLRVDYILEISNAFSHCQSLQNISFYGSCIGGDEGCMIICKNLRYVPNIKTLDLTKCSIGEVGAQCIAELIEFQRIHRLSETWKHSLRYREPDLSCMSGLRRITLNGNDKIGRNGLLYILNVLKEDYWMKAVDFQDCGADDVVASTAIDILDVNKVLNIIDLRANKGINHNHLLRIMEKLYQNNKNVDSEFNWISLQRNVASKKSNTQTISKQAIAEVLSKEPNLCSRYFRHTASSTTIPVRPARNALSASAIKGKTKVNLAKSTSFPKVSEKGFSKSYQISEERLRELLKPIGRYCVRSEDITPGTPRMLQYQAPPPTLDYSILLPTSSNPDTCDAAERRNDYGFLLQMSKEEIVSVIREIIKERDCSRKEISELKSEKEKLQTCLKDTCKELHDIKAMLKDKVLVEENVMKAVEGILEIVLKTRSDERFDKSKKPTGNIYKEIGSYGENSRFEGSANKQSYSSLECGNMSGPFIDRSTTNPRLNELKTRVFVDECGDVWTRYKKGCAHKNDINDHYYSINNRSVIDQIEGDAPTNTNIFAFHQEASRHLYEAQNISHDSPNITRKHVEEKVSTSGHEYHPLDFQSLSVKRTPATSECCSSVGGSSTSITHKSGNIESYSLSSSPVFKSLCSLRLSECSS